jgi:hypothetical protein
MNDKLEEIKGRMARAVNDDDPQYEESDWKWLVETVDKLESENAELRKSMEGMTRLYADSKKRIDNISLIVVRQNERWEKLKELPRWSTGIIPNVGHCMINSPTGKFIEFEDMQKLESIGNKVPSIPSKDGNGGEVSKPLPKPNREGLGVAGSVEETPKPETKGGK